jgi:hypothetical protein
MKDNKALRRLTKIESLMSDVTQRFSGPAALQRVLHDAVAAVTQAKDAMSKGVSSGTATKAKVEHSEPTSKVTPRTPKAKRKGSAAAAPTKVPVAPAKARTKTRTPLKQAKKPATKIATAPAVEAAV